MFKVELEFDKTLPKDKLNILCEVTDEIFAKKNILNIEQSLGKRTYLSESFADISAVLFCMDRIKELKQNLSKAIMYENNFSENLIETYFNLQIVK